MSEFFSYDLEGLEENGVELKFKCVRMQKMLDGNIKNIRVYNADFTEHDKPFEKRIKLLQEENRKLYNQLMETEKDYQAEVERLQRIINHELGDWDKSGISYQEILDMKNENDVLKKKISELASAQTIKISKKINLNDKIKVKLTLLGAEIYYHQYDEVNKRIKENGGTELEPIMPQIDKDGYTEFQLWYFMELYGEHIGIYKPNVIESLDIIIVK